MKADRRDHAERPARVIRVRREFERGAALTVGDVARQSGLAREVCWRILCELEDDNVLELTWDGRFTLRGAP
jgi:DNA-binding IclR family transcriptional regulator